jgi:IS30 family transposase
MGSSFPKSIADSSSRYSRPLDEAASRRRVRRHEYTLAELGAYLGCHDSTVSRRLNREDQMLQCKT